MPSRSADCGWPILIFSHASSAAVPTTRRSPSAFTAAAPTDITTIQRSNRNSRGKAPLNHDVLFAHLRMRRELGGTTFVADFTALDDVDAIGEFGGKAQILLGQKHGRPGF